MQNTILTTLTLPFDDLGAGVALAQSLTIPPVPPAPVPPTAKKRAVAKPATKKPAVMPPAPVAGAAALTTPVADAPVADAPVADAPVADAPVADAPVADAPTDKEPTDNSSLSSGTLRESLPAAARRPKSGTPKTELAQPLNPALKPYDANHSSGVHHVVAYCRVSLEVENTGSHTMQTQEECIETWARNHYGIGNYVIDWFSDDGVSGAVGTEIQPVRGRTGKKIRAGLKECRHALQSGEADTLAIYSLSRLGRNAPLILDVIHEDILAKGLGFISVAEGAALDPYTPAGLLMITTLAGMAAYQRDETCQRCRAAKVTTHEAGFPTGKACYGWRMGHDTATATATATALHAVAGTTVAATVDAAGNADAASESPPSMSAPAVAGTNFNYGGKRPRLFPIPEQAQLVCQMRDWFMSGLSIHAISDRLQKNGVATPDGKVYWHYTTVKNILSNPVHAGLVRMKGDIRIGEHFERRIFEGTQHDELLRLFEQRRQTQATNTGHTAGTYSLTGLAMCGHCGARLYICGPQGKSSAAMNCSRKAIHHTQGLPVPRVGLDTIEAFVEAQVRACLEVPDMQASLDQAAGLALGQEKQRLEAEKGRLQALGDQLKRRFTRLIELATDNKITGDQFSEQKAEMETSRAKARAELAAVEAALAQDAADQFRLARLHQALLDFDQFWPHLETLERRTIFEELIEKLEIYKEGEVNMVRLKLHFLPEVTGPLVRTRRKSGAWERHPNGPGGVASLTPRALALLHWHSKGLTAQEIATEMGIVLSTIRTLTSEIRHILEVHDLNEAAALARPRLSLELPKLPLGPHYNQERVAGLKPCHLQVLQFMSNGATPAEIAQETELSINTIRNYQGVIYRELGAHTAYQAVKRAKELRLLA